MDLLLEAMTMAVAEAKLSLREGNHGFGAVVLNEERIVSQAHDRDETERDPTSHAETNAIRLAARELGKDLSACTIVSTHEPCPMCASAIVWAGINEVAYGYSIEQAIAQGRDRIAIGCREVFERSGRMIFVRPGVLAGECVPLYDRAVRKEVKRLRNASRETLREHDRVSAEHRLQWFEDSAGTSAFRSGDPLEDAYALLLRRLGISADQAPIVEKSQSNLVFHSKNPCPTLQACELLGLDTRLVCRHYNEGATDALVKCIDRRLRFTRNYDRLRPYSEFCEEMIILDQS